MTVQRMASVDIAILEFQARVIGPADVIDAFRALFPEPPAWTVERGAEIAEAERLNERLVMRALALDGTCTGEHGIGLGKMKFLTAEHGDAVSVMREIKKALDPLGILNPGKIFTM